MKKSRLLMMIALTWALAGGCGSDTGSEYAEASETADSLDPARAGAIYLRGEMNDYGVSSTYQLRETSGGKLCTETPLRADWSPYRFKFADVNWSAGSNFGFAEPPGVLRRGSGPVRLNPNSRFEELTFHVAEDGTYRFCLINQGGNSYAEVEFVGK